MSHGAGGYFDGVGSTLWERETGGLVSVVQVSVREQKI